MSEVLVGILGFLCIVAIVVTLFKSKTMPSMAFIIFPSILALILIAGVMVIGTILCVLIPETLIGLFTENVQTIAMGREALHIICIGFIVSSVSVTVSGALEGLGKGVDSLIISALRYIVLMLPLAFVLSRVFGAAGVFHAFWVTEVLTAVISLMLWKKQKIWSK